MAPTWATAAAALTACAALALRTPSWAGAPVLVAALAIGLLGGVPQAEAAGARTWIAVTAVGIAAVAVVRFGAPTLPLPAATAAGLAMAVLAAVAEEALFRRMLFGLLERWGSAVAAALSAAAFAAVHVPGYGWRALPLDLAAGALFGWQRSVTGTWTSPAATHVAANLMILGVG